MRIVLTELVMKRPWPGRETRHVHEDKKCQTNYDLSEHYGIAVPFSQQIVLWYIFFCKVAPTSLCSERHWVYYTHTVPISLVILTNSSSIFFFSTIWPEFGRKRRCLCWLEPGESTRCHESLAARTQTPITRRSVWSVSRHVTTSGFCVCVRQFYWHVIVLSIGQMKCSFCHKSFKIQLLHFWQSRVFFSFFDRYIFWISDHTEAAIEIQAHWLTTILINEILT